MEKRGISAESQRNEKSMENMVLSFRELVKHRKQKKTKRKH